ncbi:MAG: tRNA (adenosine(37)-N6)-threonylcarbamoyltransferase complex ATPase subunit type 1 TsaE [Candidatus Dasytiphilus stammeri]
MNKNSFKTVLPNETATLNLGKKIAILSKNKKTINIGLSGDLGTGKTTLCRGFLQALGYQDKIKSPSYSLVESYYLSSCIVYHFDFYRISRSEEIEFLGLRDFFSINAFYLVEWPDKSYGMFPYPDINLWLDYHKKEEYRIAEITAYSKIGINLLSLM